MEEELGMVLKGSIEYFIKGLEEKELLIFRERLLADDPRTHREIGERYGISRERVRKIEERVRKKLVAYLRMERVRGWQGFICKRGATPRPSFLKKSRCGTKNNI